MSTTVCLAELDWIEYERHVHKTSPVVILPVGSLEQHGPHLPLCCDTIIPEQLSVRIAREIDGLVAPSVSYGYKSQPRSGGGEHFPGTTSLDGQTLISLVRDVIRSFARDGVRRFAVMEGHYENAMFDIEAIDLALRDLRTEGINDVKVLRVDYWEFTTPAMFEKVFPDGFPGWPLEHAGVMETSVMMALRPDLVKIDKIPTHPPARFPAYDSYPYNPADVPSSGALSSAKAASREKGEYLVEGYVREIAAALRQAFDLKIAHPKRGAAA
jgi:creatinine amidohydrolase